LSTIPQCGEHFSRATFLGVNIVECVGLGLIFVEGGGSLTIVEGRSLTGALLPPAYI
jgi:hypothetical protein